MLNYVNSFFCSYNNVEKNLIIKMSQIEPGETPDSNAAPITTEISSIIVSRDLALKLAESINTILNQQPE